MTASREDISRWYDEGFVKNARFMIVAVDTWDYENFPVYCKDAAECLRRFATIDGNSLRRVEEVYDYALGKDFQMSERRAMHLPEASS